MSFGAKLLLSLLTVVSCVLSQPPSALAAQVSISPQELAEQVALREDRVPEFKFIRDTADRLGIRVWLFGGTASGYLHYVKWDMQRERGDGRFQADRFDYDFTNIYRSTQDLDIVADGSAEEITALAEALAKQYPHFLGSKSGWEVRSLRETRGTPGAVGYKEALLNDFDFSNQDTDSNSTGMIEVTRYGSEPVVRDLREWDQTGVNHFLKDSAENKNTFYRSAKHFETARARAGQNPEIFSVIRALTKAFQYELSFSPEDWRQLQDIIRHFDPALIKDEVTLRRLKDMGKKLFLNAVNLEYAWNVLDETGLRQKLMRFDDLKTEKTLAWWMNKQPLQSGPVGEGQGKTARELGLDIVAHETNNFLAFESITRAHTGDANVFMSRDGVIGETAAAGNGFYTRIGRLGARGTGLTIRFHLAPQAREGSDFHRVNDFVIVQNKAALRVIQESLNMTPLEYFQFLDRQNTIDAADAGILEKFKRKLNRNLNVLSVQDKKQLIEFVGQSLLTKGFNTVLARAWSESSEAKQHPEIIRAALEEGFYQPEYIEKNLGLKVEDLSERQIDRIIQSGRSDTDIARQIISSEKKWPRRQQWIADLAKTKAGASALYWSGYFNTPKFPGHEKIFIEAINTGIPFEGVHHYFNAGWSAYPEIMDTFLSNEQPPSEARNLYEVLAKEPWLERPVIQKWIQDRIESVTMRKIDQYSAGSFFEIFKNPQMQNHPEFLISLIRDLPSEPSLMQRRLEELIKVYWTANPVLQKYCGPKDTVSYDNLFKAIHGKALRCEAVFQ